MVPGDRNRETVLNYFVDLVKTPFRSLTAFVLRFTTFGRHSDWNFSLTTAC